MTHLKIFFLAITISFCGFMQSQEYISTYDKKLYELDIAACSASLIGPTGGILMRDIAMTPNGSLYGSSGTSLYQINTTTAAITLIGSFPCSPGGGVSLAALDNSTLIVVCGLYLYGISVANASIYEIGYIGYTSAGDLSWYDNDLYMTGMGLAETLVKIVLNGDNTAVMDVVPIQNNLPEECIGLIAMEQDAAENVLIGFGLFSAYKICPADGSVVDICGNFGAMVYGATAPRLPIQNPLPTSCTLLSVSQQDAVRDQISIFPNPVQQDENLTIDLGNDMLDIQQIKVVNLYGAVLRSVKEVRIENNQIKMETNTIKLTAGLYILELSTSSTQFYKKILVK